MPRRAPKMLADAGYYRLYLMLASITASPMTGMGRSMDVTYLYRITPRTLNLQRCITNDRIPNYDPKLSTAGFIVWFAGSAGDEDLKG